MLENLEALKLQHRITENLKILVNHMKRPENAGAIFYAMLYV